MGEDADSKDDSGARAGETRRLIERFREAIRAKHYSRRTEEAYWGGDGRCGGECLPVVV